MSSNNNGGKPSLLERPTFVLIIAALGFFVLSFVAMGLAPWYTFVKYLEANQSTFTNPYVDESGAINAAGKGRAVYIREGCWHCHSQFVRPVAGEPFRYGPPSMFWETLFDIPQTYGTRRIGPDLAREAGKRPDDWHYAHLYDPRSVVPVSVMPSYKYFFDEQLGPKEEAVNLVTYLQTLGKGYEEDVRDMIYPKPVTVVGPVNPNPVSLERGKSLFAENCAGCHGSDGKGNGVANQFLKPSPVDLAGRYMAITEVYSVLRSGVRGSSMPSFNEMPEKDLWALGAYVNEMGKHVHDEVAELSKDQNLVNTGKQTYQTLCVSCHGEGGHPPESMVNSLVPPPRVFNKRLFSPQTLAAVMKHGRVGTAMPAFEQIGDAGSRELAAYIGTLFQEDPK